MAASSRAVVRYINAAHFFDHYAMLIIATAVIPMAAALGYSYSRLLSYATPGFIAFGAGSLAAGWLGDAWSRRGMMVVFFWGIGASMIAAGFVHSPWQLGLALLAVGLFASIYHPCGTAMLVAASERMGHALGINGIWGNVGVACSALTTAFISHRLGWRWAFILPGAAAIVAGIGFSLAVREEPPVRARSGQQELPRIPRERMWRVMVALMASVIASATTFNAVTVALPKIFSERLGDLTTDADSLGLIAAAVYLAGALSQYAIGGLIDRLPLKRIFLPLSLALSPLLFLGARLEGWLLIAVAAGIIMTMFGQVTVNDAMVGKYTSDRWRARAYSVRYFVGFSAAGASVGAVAWLHGVGGFTLLLQALSAICLLTVAAALAFPGETVMPAKAAEEPA